MSSSAQRKTSPMKNASRFTSGRGARFALFLLFARFMNDRIARCLPRAEAFGTPRRFSSWLARTDRCAKLRQNGGHDPTDLPGSHRTPFGLPRKQGRKSERAGQIQLEERQGHDPTPAQKLLRCTDVCGKPEQILFQKAEEMLFREAQTVACWHLLQGHQPIQSENQLTRGSRLVPRAEVRSTRITESTRSRSC